MSTSQGRAFATRLAGSALLAALALLCMNGPPGAFAAATTAPEFTHHDSAHWLNSAPLKLKQLRGQVVLVEFWAFDCVNCRRSAPWLHALYEKYRPVGLIIVGVHTPELPQERDRDNVRTAVATLDIQFPVMIDDDYSYWRALGNQYWPAFYLLDRTGAVSLRRIGETHPGDANATSIESAIEAALNAHDS